MINATHTCHLSFNALVLVIFCLQLVVFFGSCPLRCCHMAPILQSALCLLSSPQLLLPVDGCQSAVAAFKMAASDYHIIAVGRKKQAFVVAEEKALKAQSTGASCTDDQFTSGQQISSLTMRFNSRNLNLRLFVMNLLIKNGKKQAHFNMK